VYASKTRKEKFSGPGKNCQQNVMDVAGSLVPGRRASHRKGPTSEHGMPVSLYEQLMAAGGPQM